MPGRGQRPGLGLAVTHHTGHDKLGIIERGAEGVAQGVAEFAAFMDRSRRAGGHVAGNAAGKRKLREEFFQPCFILADVRINLAVAAFQIGIGHQCRAAMAGTGDIDHVQVVFFNDAIQMHIDEILARRGAPMSHHQRFDVRLCQLFAEQRIVVQIDLAHRQVIGGPPIRIDAAERLRRQHALSVAFGRAGPGGRARRRCIVHGGCP